MASILDRILGKIKIKDLDTEEQEIIESDQTQTIEFNYPNGQTKIRYTRKNGKKDGLYEGFYLHGQLYQRHTYKDGKKDGLFEEYYETGQLMKRKTYKNGNLEGPDEIYYADGQLTQRFIYKNGKEDGPCEVYSPKGQILRKGTYKNGKRDGIFEEYNHNGNGKLSEITIFKDDQIIEILDKFLTPQQVLPDWEKKHSNPSVDDFLDYMYGTGGNVITCIVRGGLDTLDRFFPADKWATLESIPTLSKIFAGVPRDEDLMETMRQFDSRLRMTYNLKQRRAQREKRRAAIQAFQNEHN